MQRHAMVLASMVWATLLLAGCGNHPVGHTNGLVVPSPPSPTTELQTVTVNGTNYQYVTQRGRDLQGEMPFIVSTKAGVFWIPSAQPQIILQSQPGTRTLTEADAKVWVDDKDADFLTYLYVLPSHPDVMLYHSTVMKTQNPKIEITDIHARDVITGKDFVVAKDIRFTGGYLFFLDSVSHYIIYDQETPGMEYTTAHVHLFDLKTGKDRLFWTGNGYKREEIQIEVDGKLYHPIWKPEGVYGR